MEVREWGGEDWIFEVYRKILSGGEIEEIGCYRDREFRGFDGVQFMVW